MATCTPSHTAPIPTKSLKGSPSALTGGAGGVEGYKPSGSILTRKTSVLQEELTPGTGDPSTPCRRGVPSSPCPLSILGPSVSPGPAQENAVVSFYSCPAIIFSQLRITLAKSLSSLYCFRQDFPHSPSPNKFLLCLRLHGLRVPFPPLASPPQGAAPCHAPSIPSTPLPPRWGSHRSHPPSTTAAGWGCFGGDSGELGGHRAVL